MSYRKFRPFQRIELQLNLGARVGLEKGFKTDLPAGVSPFYFKGTLEVSTDHVT